MTPTRASSRSATILLDSVDRLGRTINPRVLAVARQIGPRAVTYAERILGDAALTMNLFEESAAAVSEALKRKTNDARPVRDLSAYLYRTFLRKVSLARGKQARLKASLRNQNVSEQRVVAEEQDSPAQAPRGYERTEPEPRTRGRRS